MTHEQASHDRERGFTLLIAALVASVVLALGASIYTLAQHQITLSALGRDSQFAFYAADTAAECALYWDFRYAYFGTAAPTDPQAQNPTCDGQTIDATGRPTTAPYYPYTMTSKQINLFSDTQTIPPGGYCVQFSVSKCDGPFNADGTCTDHRTPAQVHTSIHADGYNVPCAQITTAPQALQRSVELRY